MVSLRWDAHISTHVCTDIQTLRQTDTDTETHRRALAHTRIYPGFKLYTHFPGLFLLYGNKVFPAPQTPPPPVPKSPSPSPIGPAYPHLWLWPYRPLGVVVAPRLQGLHWGRGRLSLLP